MRPLVPNNWIDYLFQPSPACQHRVYKERDLFRQGLITFRASVQIRQR